MYLQAISGIVAAIFMVNTGVQALRIQDNIQMNSRLKKQNHPTNLIKCMTEPLNKPLNLLPYVCVRAQPLQSWPTLCVPMDSPWLPEERTRDTERGKQSQGYILLGNVLFLKLESGS